MPDAIPRAFVHRAAGRVRARPSNPSALIAHGKQALAVGVGLWPLTATVLFAIGLLVSATEL